MKTYQKSEIDTPGGHGATVPGLAVPAQVSVAMAEIAGNMTEGLLALAVGAGLQVMGALMDADVTALAGVKGRHDPDRSAVRHGTGAGSVTLGGRRVPVQRPRVRAVDGSGECRRSRNSLAWPSNNSLVARGVRSTGSWAGWPGVVG